VDQHGLGSALIVIPTYNEALNLTAILDRTFAALPAAHVLVVDDGSPDGTGQLAEEYATTDDRVRVLRRTAKNGLGAAYFAGFGWGFERGYEFIVEMDADGSHPPETLPRMIAEMADAEVGLVIGSRWTRGGSVVNWPKSREALSRSANVYTRLALGIRVKDATAGFRVYRASALTAIDLSGIDSEGYCFQIDLTVRTLSAGYRVVEVPIVFREREFGESKMDGGIVIEAMSKVTAWGIGRRLSQLRRLFRRSLV
jgi:dolichol-phosphate mannosyltransferase